ncbi:MAG TPA: ABC transporter ATP-binding protein [Cellvibrionaceae bacterium]|nr:ABC transporter ATP-binding protein [Cellvibrionaceae bacterium]
MLRCSNLTLQRGGKRILHRLDWQVAAGEVWGVLGANGAGKSSLLLCLAGLLPAAAGEVHLLGRPLAAHRPRERACSLGFLAQDQTADLPIRLRDWLLLSRYPKQGLWGRQRLCDLAKVAQVLEQTQLTPLASRYTCELSGGERQRMALAGLLVQAAPWLVLDEPTNHLDLHQQMSLLPQLIAASCGGGGALVMSLHDVNLAEQFCSHCLLLFEGGEIAAGPVAQVLTAEAISRIYRHPIEVILGPSGRVFVPRRLVESLK